MFKNNLKRNHASATALRPSKPGGCPHEFSAARPCQRSALSLHSSLVTPSQPFIMKLFDKIRLQILPLQFQLLKKRLRPTFKLSYCMTCTRFMQFKFHKSLSFWNFAPELPWELSLWTQLEDFRSSDPFYMSNPLSNF